MNKCYKIYDYNEENTLITRTDQIKEYLDERLKHIDIDIDEDEITESIKETIEQVIDETLKETIEENIKETIEESLSNVDVHFNQINQQITNMANEIIENIEEQKDILDNVATKEDVVEATNKINTHTTNVFNEIDFNTKFSDLNEQIKNISNNITKPDEDIINVLSNLTDINKEKFEDGVESDIDYEKISIGGGTY